MTEGDIARYMEVRGFIMNPPDFYALGVVETYAAESIERIIRMSAAEEDEGTYVVVPHSFYENANTSDRNWARYLAMTIASVTFCHACWNSGSNEIFFLGKLYNVDATIQLFDRVNIALAALTQRDWDANWHKHKTRQHRTRKFYTECVKSIREHLFWKYARFRRQLIPLERARVEEERVEKFFEERFSVGKQTYWKRIRQVSGYSDHYINSSKLAMNSVRWKNERSRQAYDERAARAK